MRSFRSFLVFASVAAAAISPAAFGQFVEPDVVALHTLTDPDGEPGTFGWAIAEVADIDGDGRTDLIVGAPFIGGVNGRAYVYSGASGALIHRFDGVGGERLGFSMSDAGDIDLDGVHDIAVGAPFRNGVGSVYIYSGATGAELRRIDGEAAGDQFGFSVGGLGDVDGDGVPDLVVGAMLHDTGAANAGRAYVVSGSDGSFIRTHDGALVTGLLGSGAANAGDLNSDGINDYIVGARGFPVDDRGRAFVFSGVDGALIFPALEPNQTTGRDFGWFFVATPGDVNNDGVPDLYVGDFQDNGATGRAYVFSGVDAATLWEFTPGESGAGMGPGRGAGDVDQDGYDDVIVGSYTSSAGAINAGRCTIFSGRTGQPLRVITSQVANEQLGFDAVGLGDLNADCGVDYAISAANGETVYIVAGVPGTLAGDADADFIVGFSDLNLILSNFGATAPQLGMIFPDLNGDGQIGFADLNIVLTAFGDTCD